jgi:hypothetical protein
MRLTEEEEFAIGMEAWLEYRARSNHAKLCVFFVCFTALACVFVVCVVEVAPVFDCRKGDCSLADGLFVGALVSGLLLIVVSVVFCGECSDEEIPLEMSDKRAVMMVILRKREEYIKQKEANGF